MPEKTFIRLFYVDDPVRLAMLRGLLDAEGINYYVHNDHFGSLRVGPNIPLLNERWVMVEAAEEERAMELLEEIRGGAIGEPSEERGYSLIDRFRMLAEFLLFGWFMPGRSRRR